MKKYSKQDWILAGMHALAKKGESAIRIDYLCSELKVSKGSFYHHFENIDQYIHELMRFWEEECTTNIISETEKNTLLQQKADKLNQLVLEKEQKIEVVIRAWAVNDNRIGHFVEKIDEQRIAYLQKLYLERGFDNERALDYAKIEYGTFVGMQHLYRNQPVMELKRLYNVFQQLFKT